MKTTHASFATALLLFFCCSRALAQNPNDWIERSVVQINTSYPEKTGSKKLGSATGWCWKEPTLIVTALHVVAGIKNEDIIIYSCDNKKKSQATVIKVLKEADLALLRLKTDIGLQPLPILNMEQTTTKEFDIWGFPRGVSKIQGDDIRFSKTTGPPPTLNDVVTGTELKAQIKSQGYPLPEAKIFRISSTIQPGHSGAPILTADRQVIGIGDGGLHEGTALLNWAMPAAYYLPRLSTSTDPIPATVSLQNTLYSNNVTVPQDATDEEEIAMIQQESESHTIKLNTKQSISQTWSTTYRQIMDNSSEAKRNAYALICEQQNVNLDDVYFDVYEDFETGMVLTVPGGAKPIVTNGMYEAVNSEQSIFLYVLSMSYNSFSEAEYYAEATIANTFPSTEWEMTSNTTLPCKNNSANCKVICRTYKSTTGTLECSVSIKIDGEDLLLNFLEYDGPRLERDPDYNKQYVVWLIADTMIELKENGK